MLVYQVKLNPLVKMFKKALLSIIKPESISLFE